ncbi:MAG: TIGR04255 family protein [Oscillospiraceae bacterium]|nr:TIGR04255 family protein [Oscillospiraceae bacterium]
MAHYDSNFISQVIIRADFVSGSVPMVNQPEESFSDLLADFPQRNRMNRTKSEVHIQKTPQGPVKDTRTINYVENNFWAEGKVRRIAMSSEYVFLEERRYQGYGILRDTFLDVLDAMAAQYPSLSIRRLGMRYINEIKLPQADAGVGLGADFWQNYVNPWLLGGLRFAANDGALARHMCTTELNYGTDRATIRYGIFNGEYPKPNRRREFILDVDTYCQTNVATDNVSAKLDDYHAAACSVFEAAITDKLRDRMGRQ